MPASPSFDVTQVVGTVYGSSSVGTVYGSSSERFAPVEAALLVIGSALAENLRTGTFVFTLPDGPTVNVMVGVDRPDLTVA